MTSSLHTHDQTTDALTPPADRRDWAEIDDDDDGPVFASSTTTITAPKLEEETILTEVGEAVIALVQENELAVETPVSDPVPHVPTGVEIQEPGQDTSPPLPAPIRTGQAAAIPTRPRASSGRTQQAQNPRESATVLDEDGFEMKVKRSSTQASRGRGGRGGGDGERGRGGYGRGRGGRGGSTPQAQFKSTRKDGQSGEAIGTGQAIPPTRSKSILKG